MQTCIYDLKTQYEKGMDEAARAIQEGELVAMPTETVYGLAADAQNACAVEQIFLAKGRPQDNPLIVHIDRIEELDKIAFANKLAEKLAKAFWPGPLTLVVKKRPGMIPDVVTCGMDTVAVRRPKALMRGSSSRGAEGISRRRLQIFLEGPRRQGHRTSWRTF